MSSSIVRGSRRHRLAFALLGLVSDSIFAAEPFYLVHGKDPAPAFMQPLIQSRYATGGYFSHDGLPALDELPPRDKDHELYIYSIPANQIVSDGQGFQLIVDRTAGLFWVGVSGGMAGKKYAFGPGVLPQALSRSQDRVSGQ